MLFVYYINMMVFHSCSKSEGIVLQFLHKTSQPFNPWLGSTLKLTSKMVRVELGTPRFLWFEVWNIEMIKHICRFHCMTQLQLKSSDFKAQHATLDVQCGCIWCCWCGGIATPWHKLLRSDNIHPNSLHHNPYQIKCQQSRKPGSEASQNMCQNWFKDEHDPQRLQFWAWDWSIWIHLHPFRWFLKWGPPFFAKRTPGHFQSLFRLAQNLRFSLFRLLTRRSHLEGTVGTPIYISQDITGMRPKRSRKWIPALCQNTVPQKKSSNILVYHG